MTFKPVPRTLYRRPSSPKSSFLLCLPDGKCWCLSPVWSLPKQENPPTWTPTPADVEMWQIVASNLTDEEIASLDSPEGREERVSALVSSRTLGPPSASPRPTPRTLYTHPDALPFVCLSDGSGWQVPDPDLPRAAGGWKIGPHDMEGRSPVLFDLTDDEILRLCRAVDPPATIAEIKAARCLQEAEARRAAAKAAELAADKAAPAPKGRSTLYLTPREPAVLHESGNLWILYAAGSELSPPRPVPSEWIEIAQDLTSAEVASLVDPDKRFLSIFKILTARKPAPGGCDEAEVERWRTAAERAEADRQEWQALCLSHEGAIERLTRERDAARESLSATSSALRLARAEADEAHRRADAAEPEVERLRGIVVALAARLAGL